MEQVIKILGFFVFLLQSNVFTFVLVEFYVAPSLKSFMLSHKTT